MTKLIYALIILFAIGNAFAGATKFTPSHLHHHTLQLDVEHIDSLMVEQCNDGTRELHVMGNTDLNANTAFDMENITAIKLLKGKNPDDKVTFFLNGEKKTYKVSEIKAITIKTVVRAN